mmetsp:Transcript_14382/g.43464  ORF Transcript_14382/g.43464 Transcript_14382/m.43464 type:complete len:99 (-) Transcript_14382:196-492(-)
MAQVTALQMLSNKTQLVACIHHRPGNLQLKRWLGQDLLPNPADMLALRAPRHPDRPRRWDGAAIKLFTALYRTFWFCSSSIWTPMGKHIAHFGLPLGI